MDRKAWRATFHKMARVGLDSVTEPPPHSMYQDWDIMAMAWGPERDTSSSKQYLFRSFVPGHLKCRGRYNYLHGTVKKSR